MSTNNPRKMFNIDVPAEGPNGTIGVITLACIAYLYFDGTFRTLDINEALFNGKDISDYVSAAQPDVWDEWTEAAENWFKFNNEEPAPVEHD